MPLVSIKFTLFITGLLSAIFLAFPVLDIGMARFFFDGQGFPVLENPTATFLRYSAWNVTIAVFLISIVGAIVSWFSTVLISAEMGRRFEMVAALIIIGPIFLVNGVLKAFWGRARPTEVIQFGGDKEFSPPLLISDQCLSNCSFVSGEGAGAAALVLAAVILVPVTKIAWLRIALLIGIGMLAFFAALHRVMSGGHFLSDVLFSILLVVFIAQILAKIPRFNGVLQS